MKKKKSGNHWNRVTASSLPQPSTGQLVYPTMAPVPPQSPPHHGPRPATVPDCAPTRVLPSEFFSANHFACWGARNWLQGPLWLPICCFLWCNDKMIQTFWGWEWERTWRDHVPSLGTRGTGGHSVFCRAWVFSDRSGQQWDCQWAQESPGKALDGFLFLNSSLGSCSWRKYSLDSDSRLVISFWVFTNVFVGHRESLLQNTTSTF